MAISTRIAIVNRSAEAFFSEDLSPEGRSRELAAFALRNLTEAQETNRKALGGIPPHNTIVDGFKGRPEEAVRPDGVIVHEFEVINDMFAYIDLLLIKHSPVLKGDYRRSHVLYADGVEIDPSGANLPEAAEYVYMSALPYSRKIERGLSRQAPSGVYEVTAALANRRFGNLARAIFSYRSPLGGYVALGGRRGGKKASAEKRAAHNSEAETRVPAIIIMR